MRVHKSFSQVGSFAPQGRVFGIEVLYTVSCAVLSDLPRVVWCYLAQLLKQIPFQLMSQGLHLSCQVGEQ